MFVSVEGKRRINGSFGGVWLDYTVCASRLFE